MALSGDLLLTHFEEDIKNSNIYIITVPTPVDKNNKPDLMPLKLASLMVGNYLKENDIVIYESTVFPGATEDICVPILEKQSSLKYNVEFFCGYSPERINPGDKEHTLKTIIKITSGSNEKTAKIINDLYASIVTAGVFQASSIKVAEAAKVIENTQRDVNIALVNELALIFNKMNLDTNEILEAAGTKWNFLSFRPGLVGGHCIGVDPYYLTYKASELGYHPEIILAGRRINDNMGLYIAEKTIEQITEKGISPLGAKIAILGITFKEDCPDMRNTKVCSIIEKLSQYKCDLSISDYWVESKNAKEQFGYDLKKLDEISNQDAVIIAVGHQDYKVLKEKDWDKLIKPGGVIIDVKSIFDKEKFSKNKYHYWRL
tara:strand:- start:3667 stop:4788 length:1122 start_codon:yes stop_codon:yes gene_type:complete